MCDSIRVQINSEESNSSSIQAITTESRDLPVSEAEARIRSIATRLPSGTEIFKKIDSAFRGNTVAEIAATLRHVHFDIAIIAPAYPALGRTVRKGVLHIHDVSAVRSLPLTDLLAATGCSLTLLHPDLPPDELADVLGSCLSNPKPAILCDATSQDDLVRVVSAARSLGNHILWIGSGGLAHALAAEFPTLKSERAMYPRPGHMIYFIGSPHPVTRAQVDHLRSRANNSSAMTLIPIVLGKTTADGIRRVAATHDPAEISCLFMTGGDTAHFVCRALGIHALRLNREFAPGVPLAIAEGGPFDGVSVVLKSGGFSEPDLLCRLLETSRPEAIA
jgi:uncharacterized protein YgbK (DUF1537 family)